MPVQMSHAIKFLFFLYAGPRILTSKLIYNAKAIFRGSIQNSQQKSSSMQILALCAIGLLDHIKARIVTKP